MENNYTEFTGKTVEEAVEEGLKELGLKESEADVVVLEEGKKKLFGSVKARVRIAAKSSLNASGSAYESRNVPSSDMTGRDEIGSESESEAKKERKSDVHRDALGRTDGERAVEFIEGLFDILRITAATELVREGEKIEINVTAANTNAVIGKRGAILDSIQTIAGAVANTGRTEYKRVVVDCENYRENREETLRRLADNLAQKAVRYEKKIKLEPMNPYERRIIHAALSENPEVTTQSEGKEPYRYIVIIPNNVRYPDRPASPARPEPFKKGGYNNVGYKKQFNRDGRRPYNNNNREYNGRDGYKKPYNRDYNRDGRRPYNNGNGDNRDYSNRDGYRKPYNKDYNRGGYDRSRSDGSGSDINGERRDYANRSSSYKKPSSDFFGTYLGNSKDNKDE